MIPPVQQYFTPMQGFKGLLPRQVLVDDAFVSIFRKAEQHQRAAQICIDFFAQINKFFQSFSAVVQKSVIECDIGNVNAAYYRLIGFVCQRLVKENKQLTQNTKGSSKQLTKVCNAILDDFSKFIQAFQGNVRKYIESEQILQELSKKYFRSHKNMLTCIEAYKSSFTDVTLIYNVEEKNKRYQTCEANYKTIASEYKAIMEKSELLNDRKTSIIKSNEGLIVEFTKVIKMIGSKVIGETKNFFGYYCATNKSIITFLAQQKYNLQKQRLEPFFACIEDPSKLQFFDLASLPTKPELCRIPMIFKHPELIKEEYLESYNAEMINYLRKVEEHTEKRRSESKRVNEIFNQYFKNIEKVHIIGVKQILVNFDKFKAKITQSFGPKLASFVKSINKVFEFLSGIDQKMIKHINPKLVTIQSLVLEQAKLLKLFNDELKSNIERLVGKKELKKLKEEQFTEQSVAYNAGFRKEIIQKASFIKHLISGFNENMSKTCEKMSKLYTSVIHDLSESINQCYSLCCEYQELYFGAEEFTKNFQAYQNDVDALIEKNKGFYDVFSFLKNETSKITFDGQFNKVQDFKKLKKPTPIQSLSGTKEPKQKEAKDGEPRQFKEKQSNLQMPAEEQAKRRTLSEGKVIIADASDINRKNSTKQVPTNAEDKDGKYLQFLLSKVQFKQNEQFIKSFSCALSEKIVLHGRIYITTERICFHSGFNSNNLFFGGTFIQFPKEDITKIQKRLNALLMDNSLSFTTVKGELFFTSFFSRNEAYDLICKTFSINADQHVYQFEESQAEQVPHMIIDIKEEDDIKDEDLQVRKAKIEEIMTNFEFLPSSHFEITKQGLTALQIFKTFYADNEILINRRKYPSFLLYFKDILGHKQLDITPWDPSLDQTLNQSNIKQPAPYRHTRTIKATVPVANSGVPFMPKTAKSQQNQVLYFLSRHKWIMDSEISTSGVPYSDTFKVQLRVQATSDQTGKCKIELMYFVNFVKSTMMKSVIEGKSQEESIKAARIFTDQISKYFKNLSKSEKALLKTEAQSSEYKEQLQARAAQCEALQKQVQTLRSELLGAKQDKQKNFKVILGLIVLNIMLLILLLS